MKTKTIVIGLLLNQLSLTEAVKIEKHTTHKQKKYDFDDREENDIDKSVIRYNDASNGNVKTNAQYAEEAEAINPSKIYKVLHPFNKEEDTGDRYVNTHRCFGGPCKDSLM